MAIRFAVASTPWNTPSTWDNGAVPLAGDTVHPNGFTVPIDTDISVDSLNNNTSPVYLPNMPIPKMTGNTQPSGTVNAGSDVTNAWKAFDQEITNSTSWSGTGATTGTAWLSYQFPIAKTIKRYFFTSTGGTAFIPRDWTFQGSNDGSTWTTLDTVVTTQLTTYVSVLLANTNAYLYYRINISAAYAGGVSVQLSRFEMTESTATSYGTGSGGSFTVPSSLSGTRNITFSGAGLMGTTTAGTTILSLDNNLTNTVNLNKTSGAYIINPLYNITDGASTVAININNNGIVNINGDIYGTTTNGVGNLNGIIRVVSNPTITVNGNLYPVAGRNTVATYLFNFLTTSTNATFTINGDVIGGNLYSNTYSIFVQSVNTVNIFGNLTSNIGYCYYSTTASFLNLTGTANLTNVNSVPCIFMNSTSSLLTMNGAIINKGNVLAVSIQKMRYVSTSNPYWIFQNTLNNDIILGYNSTGPYPAEIDVRAGITYSSSPTRTGTCAVPLPQYVSQGVPIDQTVGTAVLTAEDFLDAISTSSNVIATRLKNVSTVQTTGDQMSSFNV